MKFGVFVTKTRTFHSNHSWKKERFNWNFKNHDIQDGRPFSFLSTSMFDLKAESGSQANYRLLSL